MKLTLIAMGHKMPLWVKQGTEEYTKRFSSEQVIFNCIEIPLRPRRDPSALSRSLAQEMHLMQTAIPQDAYVVALTIPGKAFSSEQLAAQLQNLQHRASHICFLIGGPEGLSPELIHRCDDQWSLSKLTLPHSLVRVVLVEALYRACSIIQNHPYHK